MRRYPVLVRQALNHALSAVLGALIIVIVLVVAYSFSETEPPGFFLLSIVGLVSIATALLTLLHVVSNTGRDSLQH
ncbi:MAG: hypothetical protein M1358_17645 [Chloroflexi bacterium]|nr:hypothetical protein [Chloroflexota bacterium]